MSRVKILMGILALLAAVAVGAYPSLEPKTAARNPNVPLPEEIIQQNHKVEGEAEIYLAGGCFWGTEFLMRNVPGVVNVEVGYSNGTTRNPTYRDVCKGSGHAESAHVIYNPNAIPLPKLLSIYYQSIDPTVVNKQGSIDDLQYRAGIYYSDSNDAPVIRESLNELQGNFFNKISVECEPIKNFYRAEEEHQEYLIKNPVGYCHMSRSMIDEQAKVKAANHFADKDFSRSKVYGKPTEATLASLNDMQRAVTQEGATEPPYKNEYNEETRAGIYVDVTNGQPLFMSKDKVDSCRGWPAFAKPIDENFIVKRKDFSFGRDSIEVKAKASGSHLGHLTDDCVKEGGDLRYCINSAALRFIPVDKMREEGYGDWLDLFAD